MNGQIFEQHMDERGNVSVRISDEFVVLTHDKAKLITTKIDALQRENDQLKTENAKLREYIERKKVLQDYAKLFDDNAKLRDLLSDYQTCTNRSCPECRYYDECFDGNHATCCIAIDILDKRAQEFGIGVRDELGTQVQP